METSRKRFNSENDGEGKKRKSQKSKEKSASQIIASDVDSNMDYEDANNVSVTESNDSSVIALHLIQTCYQPYSRENDEKIINYFKENMNLLNMKDDLSVYHVLKAKYSFQISAKSLQSRFLNFILPNLFKYDVINHSDLIDFYDAAKLELPDEFIKILDEQEITNKNSKSTSSYSHTSKQFDNRSKEKGSNEHEITNIEYISIQNENIAGPSTSRQSVSETEVACVQSNILEEKCFESILGFIRFNNSKDTCIFIPNTESNIPSIVKILLDEFGIQQDSIKIISKSKFDLLKKLMEMFNIYNKQMKYIFKTRVQDATFMKMVLLGARKLLEFSKEIKSSDTKVTNSKASSELQANELLNVTGNELLNVNANELLNVNANELLNVTGNELLNVTANELLNVNTNECESPVNNKTPIENESTRDVSFKFDSTFCEMEISGVGQIISNLSDSFDYVSISSNVEIKECNLANKNFENIKIEPIDADDVETVVCSPYFLDDTYSEDNTNVEATSANNQNSENNIMDTEYYSINNSLIDSVPQIMFSKRCKDKIENENINVDYLIIKYDAKKDVTSNDDQIENQNINVDNLIECVTKNEDTPKEDNSDDTTNANLTNN